MLMKLGLWLVNVAGKVIYLVENHLGWSCGVCPKKPLHCGTIAAMPAVVMYRT